MSSDSPWGSPSTMSIRTTSSASPFWTTRIAVVAPTNPLPTIVTRMPKSSRPGDGQEAILRRNRRGRSGAATSRGGGLRRDQDARYRDLGLLEHEGEVVRRRGDGHRVHHGHGLVLDQLEERLVERLHAVGLSLGDDVVDLRRG